MYEDCGNRIISEAYRDFIVDYELALDSELASSLIHRTFFEE